ESERLLREGPGVGDRYNQRYPYIMIDEYQDTNRPQYQLMRLLTRQSQNLCVVGDEDQSIYSWRGADIRNILDFERDYPDTRVIRLEQNYRSTKNILEAASSVVANNQERKGKVLWTEAGAGAPIGYYLAPEAESEALFVAETIRASLAKAPQRRVAVLYRTNAQSRLFEEALRRLNVNYRVIGGFSFYERAEVRDLLAYLKVAANPADSIALQRIINTPTRGIGKSTQETLERLALEQNLTLLRALEVALEGGAGLPARSLGPLAEFYKLLAELRSQAVAGAPVDELLRQAIDRTGYARLLQMEETPEAESRLENLGELVNAATDAASRGEDVAAFLDHAALVSDQDDFDAGVAVQLMSLHSAKGLEFGLVFLAGMEEGLFPHSRTRNSPAELEEERRLCYVGMTRAREQLYLTHAARRRRFGGQLNEPSEPSRFLSEVPRQLLRDDSPVDAFAAAVRSSGPRYVTEGYSQEEPAAARLRQFLPTAPARPAPSRALASPGGWRSGARVRHAKFGVGTVLRVEGEGDQTKLTISFPGFGLKKLLEKVAALTSV